MSNEDKLGTEDMALRVRRYLEEQGHSCMDMAREKAEGANLDCLLVIGGDGTILKQVNWAVQAAIPLLGINMGRVGFLSEVEPSWLEEGLDALLNGRYQIETRALLSGEVEGEQRLALNDFMLGKKHPSRTVEVGILVDGKAVAEYSCDGVLVSTPTGSTGYALSAGGPVLSPELPVTIVTPVCAHNLSARPMLFSAEATIELVLLDDHDNRALVCTDGDVAFGEFAKGDVLRVRKSSERVQFLRIRENNYFQLVRKKLG